MLACLGAATVAASVGRTAEQGGDDEGLKGVPKTTVEELVVSLRKEGFQWRFVGRQITFTATVVAAGAAPRVKIADMDEGKLDTAVIHNALADNHLKAGEKVQVHGLIVDQWYGVWQVWKYTMKVSTA
jgi:hypothetical protein